MQNQQNFCTFFDHQPNNTNRLLRTMEKYKEAVSDKKPAVNCSTVGFKCPTDTNQSLTMFQNRCYSSTDISNGTPKPNVGSRWPICNDDSCRFNGSSCVSKS
jgi:hypothetical protein